MRLLSKPLDKDVSILSLHDPSSVIGAPMDDLLAAYAVGTLNPALHRLIAAHLAIKADNRAFVASLESLAAMAMDEAPAAPVADRDRRLAAIFAQGDRPSAQRRPIPACDIVPAPLCDLIGNPVNHLAWKTRLPGIREFHVKDSGASDATLYWIRPGRVMPSHTHEGSEFTLVLRGGFTDGTGHYRRGDIAIADADIDHRPRADDDEDCICFAVTDAPLRLTGPVARLVQKIFRH
jgi:putative transcriptional regulator